MSRHAPAFLVRPQDAGSQRPGGLNQEGSIAPDESAAADRTTSCCRCSAGSGGASGCSAARKNHGEKSGESEYDLFHVRGIGLFLGDCEALLQDMYRVSGIALKIVE
jgi:hypothetical protein